MATNSSAAAADFFLEGVVEAVAGVVGERGRFGIAEDVDCFLRRIYYYSAILAFRQVVFNFRSKCGINSLIEII